MFSNVRDVVVRANAMSRDPLKIVQRPPVWETLTQSDQVCHEIFFKF